MRSRHASPLQTRLGGSGPSQYISMATPGTSHRSGVRLVSGEVDEITSGIRLHGPVLMHAQTNVTVFGGASIAVITKVFEPAEVFNAFMPCLTAVEKDSSD